MTDRILNVSDLWGLLEMQNECPQSKYMVHQTTYRPNSDFQVLTRGTWKPVSGAP
jgi:hypothetical protein